MPFILIASYRFGFFSLDRGEPAHVHVFRGEKEAKVWLQPIMVAWNYGYNQRELNRIAELALENQSRLLEMWHEHFG